MSTPDAGGRATATPVSDMNRQELLAHLAAVRAKQLSLKKHVAQQDEDMRNLRSKSVEVQQAAEVEEERMSNALFKRVDDLRHSNQAVVRALRAGEEKNQAVLSEIGDVRKHKADIENKIEAEQERMLNNLHQQLLGLASEKSRLERVLHSTRQDVLTKLQSEVERLQSKASTPDSPTPHSSRCSSRPIVTASPETSSTQAEKFARTSSSILELEAELRRLIAETARQQELCSAADSQHAQLSEQLRQVQQDSFLAKARAAKLRSELEKAHADLAAERASSAVTPNASVDATPLHGQQVHTQSLPASHRRSHHRTHSGSSVESWSSASVNTTPLNLGLAREDPESLRQHTARVLSSTHAACPSPMRRSASQPSGISGRSSAAPQL